MGTGFSITGQHDVRFNGLPAAATWVSATELVITAPDSAAIGPVLFLVGTEKGFAMSPKPFIVRRP